ncbi:hypothetical protein Ahy_A09g046020 [Arachis hypogaea]|uniref:Uncharacterized protein n=1 Tax=Arachis hypogaea TaxID=3818 RepID=A0A445BNP0_ARAHY|nr:hypothetical protein Ahy_A09g046020 [Arachis hypogaea]
MIIVRMETHSQSEPLDIISIQVCMPPSQSTAASPIQVKPSPTKSPSKKISKETIKGCISFGLSLGFTDSSQEETLTQEGRPGSEKGKSSETPILIEELEELVEQIVNTRVKAALNFAEDKSLLLEKQPADQIFEKFKTPARRKESSADLKEKCYLWTTHIKTYGDGSTNDWESMCILNAQQPIQLSKIHFTSLKASTHIEVEIVSAMCLILNKQNRLEEEIYCLPPTIAVRTWLLEIMRAVSSYIQK